jgi:hypothetical protein
MVIETNDPIPNGDSKGVKTGFCDLGNVFLGYPERTVGIETDISSLMTNVLHGNKLTFIGNMEGYVCPDN